MKGARPPSANPFVPQGIGQMALMMIAPRNQVSVRSGRACRVEGRAEFGDHKMNHAWRKR